MRDTPMHRRALVASVLAAMAAGGIAAPVAARPPAPGPPAMQGAQPRQVVDQPNVQVEQMQQQFRRGALPPPK